MTRIDVLCFTVGRPAAIHTQVRLEVSSLQGVRLSKIAQS